MVDLGSVSAVINIVSALGVIAVMQSVTRDFSPITELGTVKLFHRLAFVALALALSFNAFKTLETGSDPRIEDLLLQIALTGVVSVSFIRHLMAPRLNREAHDNWTKSHPM